MSPAVPRALEEGRVRGATARAVSLMAVDGWADVAVECVEKSDQEHAAETVSEWEYRQCCITWNLAQTRCMTDWELLCVAVHEVTHLLLDPVHAELSESLKARLAKHIELATENVARSVLAANGSLTRPDDDA